MTNDPRSEREPFGITYDRLRLDRVFERLVAGGDIHTALELPAGGAKAMPGIYSLALARYGVDVTLVNPEPQGLAVYDRLDLPYRVARAPSTHDTGLAAASYDLVWNFVTAALEPDFEAVIEEMARLSRRYVMTVHCNGFNYGYPWHRLLHRLFGLPWTHGETAYFFPENVRSAYRAAGLRPRALGLFDMPWWPDPPGFRDIRLHLVGGDTVEELAWTAPIEDIYGGEPIPRGLRLLSFIEDLPLPRLLRWPFSHLFYVLGETP